MKYYTGVGSREIPQNKFYQLIAIGEFMADKKFILRSGAADGSDVAFETGCNNRNGRKEIYLPWRRFNNHRSELHGVSDDAIDLAEQIHPAFNKCSVAAQKLHARNCYQVLGRELKTPSSILICFTGDGTAKGGTRTAIKLAEMNKIPVLNTFAYNNTADLIKILDEILESLS